MKIAVIHGQTHKGITYSMTKEVLTCMEVSPEDMQEFFLPKDGPGFCIGCNTCFLNGEDQCPGAGKVQPVIKAMEAADLIILDSPNYAMEMSGSMKNLMDHFAYRWVTHRPSGEMFTKTGITVCSSAGAPCKHTTHSMARQLKWMGVSNVYEFPLISNAMGVSDLSDKKKDEIKRKAKTVAKKAKVRIENPHASLRGKLFFAIFRKMQLSPNASWNPTDRDWWVKQGWTKKVKPWDLMDDAKTL